MAINLPAEKYIKRNVEMIAVSIRIPKALRKEVDQKCVEIDCSFQRFIEASIEWYLDELERTT